MSGDERAERDDAAAEVTAGNGGGVELDELADLQAGLLTEDEERVLRARMDRDPGAAALWEALERTRTELTGLPDEPLPDDVAVRLDAAIAAELGRAAPTDEVAPAPAPSPAAPLDADADGPRGGAAPVLDLARARQRRRLPRWVAPGAVVGLAAAAAVVGVIAIGTRSPQPLEGSAPAAPVLTAGELAGQWPGVRGAHDLGFLAPPGKLTECLGPYAPPGGGPATVLGARPVVLDGRYGVLVAVPGPYDYPVGDQVQLVVLGPQCSQNTDHDVIATATAPL